MPSKTFTFRGHKIRTTTHRRFVAVHISHYDGKARIEKRSDTVAVVRNFASNFPSDRTGVVDTITGEEI